MHRAAFSWGTRDYSQASLSHERIGPFGHDALHWKTVPRPCVCGRSSQLYNNRTNEWYCNGCSTGVKE